MPSFARGVAAIVVAVAISLSAGCREDVERAPAPASRGPEVRTNGDATAAAHVTNIDRPRVVALGDSLTAGLGLDASQAYPALLQSRLDQAGYGYEVVNMGVSGDTSAGGLRRLDWALEGDVRILIVALGGNDGLRGLPTEDLARNLSSIVDRARARGIRVVLCGMEAPPNFGPAYTRAFREVFPRIAREKHVALVPFLLEGVAGVSALNQGDGIHPNAEGARRVADVVWRQLEPILQETATR